LARGLSRAVAIDVTPVVQGQLRIRRDWLVLQGSFVVLTSINVVNRLSRRMLVLGGVVGDAAVTELGCGHGEDRGELSNKRMGSAWRTHRIGSQTKLFSLNICFLSLHLFATRRG
jgi:hypothetical protein